MDKGAIKPILSGSDVMCPGLTSPSSSQFYQNPYQFLDAKMVDLPA